MSTKSPSMIAQWPPIDRTSPPPPPAAPGRRREQARDLDLRPSPYLPAASGGLVGRGLCPRATCAQGVPTEFSGQLRTLGVSSTPAPNSSTGKAISSTGRPPQLWTGSTHETNGATTYAAA